jgi:CheY-like chemotaxis protein
VPLARDVLWSASVQPRVLVAEDDGELRELIATLLARSGCHVSTAEDGVQLIELAEAYERSGRRLDVIVSDIQMPGCSGFGVVSKLSRKFPDVPVILITAFGDPSTHRQARALGARAVLDKPFPVSRLRRLIEDHLAPSVRAE